jgi:twitching motility protein PilU
MSNHLVPEQARAYMAKLLDVVHKSGASDMFITAGFPPSMKVHGEIRHLSAGKLTPDLSRSYVLSMMTERQKAEFEQEKECNFAITFDSCRFRVNAFMQQLHTGMVVRTIASEVPTLEKFKLPEVLKDIVMAKRGLVLMVGASGSGKSTSLAAMLDHRNASASGHIVTIEDPLEFVHESKKCMITHREVGADTHSMLHALKNAMRQAPDVIMIGEVRDTDAMEHAIAFSETGHLCLATLHANNANQTLDRIVNFFPEERRPQLLMSLSSNLKAIVSQRLVRSEDGQRRVATEILINTPTVAEMILKGQFQSIKEVMAKSRELGMQTFDQALFDLYEAGDIGYDDALRNADSLNELRLNIKLKAQRGEPKGSAHVSATVAAAAAAASARVHAR